jgi:hypothetical protein
VLSIIILSTMMPRVTAIGIMTLGTLY